MIELSLFFYLLLALIIGVIIGTITGITPGIHINLVSVFILSLSLTIFTKTNPLILVVFIIAMSITHTFIDFIPSILLGSPDLDTSLSVLPGHEFLLDKKAYHAIVYTLYGSLIGIFVILLFTPAFIYILPKIYPYLKEVMFFILLFASAYLLIREKNKTLAIILFILSGFLGLVVFNLNMKESLLPMLTGLFGSSSLITSILKKQKLPKQEIPNKRIKIKLKEFLKVLFSTSIASPICSIFPALGSGQAAVVASDITGETNKKEFLILLGSINTIIIGLSVISLYSLNIKRTGTSFAISQLLSEITKTNLIIILLSILLSGILSFIIGIYLAKYFSSNIHKINYRDLSFFILFFISVIVIIFSSWLGFLVYIISTFLGLYAIYSGSRRTLLMGCLIIPTLLIYLPI